MGQRQLLSIARLIVSRPRIIVLDEATSAVDVATDTIVRRSIRAVANQSHSTLLVITHHLTTIADFDRILVIDSGRVVESGSPYELWKLEGGVLRSLIEESQDRESIVNTLLVA